jgi:hypothetical protein
MKLFFVSLLMFFTPFVFGSIYTLWDTNMVCTTFMNYVQTTPNTRATAQLCGDACVSMGAVFQWFSFSTGGSVPGLCRCTAVCPALQSGTNSDTYKIIASTSTPTRTPSNAPTRDPTATPSFSLSPTVEPTISPTESPSVGPSFVPSCSPSTNPTAGPTASPSIVPTVIPSVSPTLTPTVVPSLVPSIAPSRSPSIVPTMIPTAIPIVTPTTSPSVSPSFSPSASPSVVPSLVPTAVPSSHRPSEVPSAVPTVLPTPVPSASPSLVPTVTPTETPSVSPTTRVPSVAPTVDRQPTATPTGRSKATIVVNAALTVSSVNGAALNPTSQETIKQSIANASHTPVNNVDLLSVTRTDSNNNNNRRRLLTRSSVHSTTVSLFSYSVVAEIHFNLVDFPDSFNASYVATIKSQLIVKSVKTGVLQQTVRFYAMSNNATQLLEIAVENVTVTATIAPADRIFPIDIHSGYQVGMNSEVVLPVIIVIPFGIAVIFLIVICLFNKSVPRESFSSGRMGMILGSCVMALSCVQFSINLAGYSQLIEPQAGSWWIGIAAFFPSLFSTFFNDNYRKAGLSTVFLFCALMIGLICTIGDGLYYSHVLRGIQACSNQDGHFYGDSDYFAAAEICQSELSPSRDLACIHRNNERCYYFEGITNGDYLLSTYTSIMEAGFVFDIVLTTSLFLLFGWQFCCLFSLDSFFSAYLRLEKRSSPKPLELVIVDDKEESNDRKNDLERGSYELVVVASAPIVVDGTEINF